MLKKRYYCVNGVMVGQTLDDGSNVFFQVDAQGSVVGTVGTDGVVQNSYRFKPSGALLSKTGTGDDPDVLWVGTRGYWAMSRAHSDYYVRARHYGSAEGAWTTVDPLWPRQRPYAYASGNPVSFSDSSGLQVIPPNTGGGPWWPSQYWPKWPPKLPSPPPILPLYGNYCGPQTIPGPELGPPMDELDKCCATHDDCFSKNGCTAFNQVVKGGCRKCTDALCACMAFANCNWGWSCNGWRAFFISTYCKWPFI